MGSRQVLSRGALTTVVSCSEALSQYILSGTRHPVLNSYLWCLSYHVVPGYHHFIFLCGRADAQPLLAQANLGTTAATLPAATAVEHCEP